MVRNIPRAPGRCAPRVQAASVSGRRPHGGMWQPAGLRARELPALPPCEHGSAVLSGVSLLSPPGPTVTDGHRKAGS